jgi:hypothetical protein
VQCILEPYDLAARGADDLACDRRLQQWMKEHLMRKYANRRLYDATASRHVTFEDIRM